MRRRARGVELRALVAAAGEPVRQGGPKTGDELACRSLESHARRRCGTRWSRTSPRGRWSSLNSLTEAAVTSRARGLGAQSDVARLGLDELVHVGRRHRRVRRGGRAPLDGLDVTRLGMDRRSALDRRTALEGLDALLERGEESGRVVVERGDLRGGRATVRRRPSAGGQDGGRAGEACDAEGGDREGSCSSSPIGR